MKKLLLLVALIFSVLPSFAQLYYFKPENATLNNSTNVYIVYINGSDLGCTQKKYSEIIGKNASDSSYWITTLKKQMESGSALWRYDSELSTSSFTVYKSVKGNSSGSWGDPNPNIYYYRAISSDGNTLIVWRQRKGSEEVIDRRNYVRISDSTMNADPHDFLK